MTGERVRVRRERPTVLAWSIALVVTMLVVYVLTLSASAPLPAKSVWASPRVTREIRLEALEGWCVSLGTWLNEDQARIEAAGYAACGAAGFAWPAEGAWHVIGALYDSSRAAQRAAVKLRDNNDIDAQVLHISAEAVSLRVTAPEALLERIEAGEALLRGQCGQLSSLAGQLDAGALQPEAARTLCALSASEAESLVNGLSALPEANEDALCKRLIDALSRLSVQLSEISASARSGSTALSGMLRMAAIDDFLTLKTIQEGLAQQRQA